MAMVSDRPFEAPFQVFRPPYEPITSARMRTPGVYRVARLVVAGAIAAAAYGVDAQTCAVPANTLSLNCGSACVPYEPCMLKTASSACDLECFTIDSAKRKQLRA